jgi:hypothetical protein
MRCHRALILLLFVGLLALTAATGGVDALLTVSPLAAIAALLVSGRFVGEERLLRGRQVTVIRTIRPASTPRRPQPTHARPIFLRSPKTRRGPPVVALV